MPPVIYMIHAPNMPTPEQRSSNVCTQPEMNNTRKAQREPNPSEHISQHQRLLNKI